MLYTIIWTLLELPLTWVIQVDTLTILVNSTTMIQLHFNISLRLSVVEKYYLLIM